MITHFRNSIRRWLGIEEIEQKNKLYEDIFADLLLQLLSLRNLLVEIKEEHLRESKDEHIFN